MERMKKILLMKQENSPLDQDNFIRELSTLFNILKMQGKFDHHKNLIENQKIPLVFVGGISALTAEYFYPKSNSESDVTFSDNIVEYGLTKYGAVVEKSSYKENLMVYSKWLKNSWIYKEFFGSLISSIFQYLEILFILEIKDREKLGIDFDSCVELFNDNKIELSLLLKSKEFIMNQEKVDQFILN